MTNGKTVHTRNSGRNSGRTGTQVVLDDGGETRGSLTPDQVRRRAMFDARLDGLAERAFGYKARFLRLEDILLSVGGWAAVPPLEVDGLADALCTAGVLFSVEGLTCVQMEPSACHTNTVEWYLDQTEDDTSICTGYALSSDGLWRQHSWGLENGQIVETTIERVAYYGLEGTPGRGV